MDSDDKYETRLEIKAYDRANLVTDIMKLLSEQKIQCNGIKARIATDGYANIHIIVMIRNKDEIAELNRKLRKINGIYEINRFSKRQKIR